MTQIEQVQKLFGSGSRVAVLKLFLENEGKRFRVNEIGRKCDVNKRLASLEIKKLIEIGIIIPEVIGNVTFYKLNTSSLFAKPLKELFTEHD